ncbi:hypothetical protein DFS33DRAFT_1484409 [Desarmillaria ectypa]|nr:hypothetical protein DFS33DRAFT_1484409 [Desarmillaria ectypa]
MDDLKMMAVTFKLPRTQHALSKPEEWNASWERLCSSGVLFPPICLGMALKMERREIGDMAFEYPRLLQNTLGLRFDIGVEGVDALLYHDLKYKWLAATPATRRQHARVGLSEAGDILTLESLSKGHTHIDLLKAIIPDDISVLPKIPCHFQNPICDLLCEVRQTSVTEYEKLWLAEAQMLRSKLIYYVLVVPRTATSKDYCGEKSRPYYIAHAGGPIHGDKEENLRWENSQAKLLEKIESVGVRIHCWTTLKRDVPHCSRECQTADHKSRHKAICGKEIGLEEAVSTALKARGPPKPTFSQTGTAVDGFKRSLDLLYHVFKLNQDPEADLYLRTKEGIDSEDCFTRIDTPFLPIQNLIRAARDKAMITGDRVPLYILWFCLSKGLDKERSWDFKVMIDQMAKEYEFLDLKKAMPELQVKPLRDPVMRPPLVQSLSMYNWTGYLDISPVDMSRKVE